MAGGGEAYRVVAPVWRWGEGKGSWHFLSVSGEVADAIRFDTLGMRGGFNSVKVSAFIDGVDWTTSLFPSGDDWILPLKADVRRRANIGEGATVEVVLRLA